MKKFFKYLGFGILSVVIFFIGIGVVASINTVDKEAVFEPFIVKAIPKLTTWEVTPFKEPSQRPLLLPKYTVMIEAL